jgi:cyclopropane-fatty-acyl-phospholipid synthase
LKAEFADGSTLTNYDRAEGEADVAIVFKSPRAAWRSALFFPDGIPEAWIAGGIDIIGQRPLSRIARLMHTSLATTPGRMMPVNPLLRAQTMLREWRTNNRSFAQAKRNAEFHYSIDHRFFEMILGPTMGYSEGHWIEGTRTLDQAKHNLYEYVCRKLRLKAGDRVVEVGSGWGYMPILMAKKFGADVTVYNPVKAQNDFMDSRFRAQGVGDRIRLFEKDHRDIALEPGAYDKFVSIGVQEHCGRDCYRAWIEAIARALKPGGIGVISTTSLMHKEYTNSVVTRHIFPGGHIPSLPLILQIMDECGLTLVEVESLWPHYQRTLAQWFDNLEARWPEIQRLDPAFFTERFRRAWTYYLDGTSENFGYALDLSHIVFTKGRASHYYDLTHERLRNEAQFATGDTIVDPLR